MTKWPDSERGIQAAKGGRHPPGMGEDRDTSGRPGTLRPRVNTPEFGPVQSWLAPSDHARWPERGHSVQNWPRRPRST